MYTGTCVPLDGHWYKIS